MKPHILIVDDDPDFRKILTYSMQAIDPSYQVEVACDGFEALELISKKTFDVVLADYAMPGMDGLELIESISALSSTLEVILVSAFPAETLVELAKEANVTFFLTKPFDVKVLHQNVQQVLQAKLKAADESTHPETEQQPALSVNAQLQELCRHTGSLSCFLITSEGRLIGSDSKPHHTELEHLSSLIAANMANLVEISRRIGNETFETTVHVGPQNSIALHRLTTGEILAVIFDGRAKIGLIQHYLQKTCDSLTKISHQWRETHVEDEAPKTETKISNADLKRLLFSE